MTSEFTERLIADIRNGDAPISVQERALLELADQRDDLISACEALIAYRDKVGPLSFQLEKADDYIRAMRLAVEAAMAKAKGGEHNGE